MKECNAPTLYVCTGCHRRLPAEAFYFNKSQQRLDHYCRECRKGFNALQRRSSQYVNKKPDWPLITDEPDRERRLLLIRHARQVVRESMERKRRQITENLFSLNPQP